MRTLIIQDYLRCGGTERQSVHLARHLRSQGEETSVLTFRPGGPLADELASANVPHSSLQPFDTGLNFLVPGLFYSIRKWQPHVILCMGRMANCYGGFIQHRFPKIAVVGSVRTGKPLPPMTIWSFRQVSGVLTNTEWWRTRLIQQCVDPGKIAVVPNGLTHDWKAAKASKSRKIVRRELALGPSTVVFLNVADFRMGKRQARLIEFFSRLDPEWDCQLWLVGGGVNWDHCRRLAGRLGSERIRLMGHSADPQCWYAAADVAVSASIEDSLPNFLVEAQTLGLPVIATEFQGVGEALRDGETGYLVAPEDDDAFRAAVRELYLRRKVRRQMGRRAKAFAKERFASAPQASKARDALRTFLLARNSLLERHA